MHAYSDIWVVEIKSFAVLDLLTNSKKFCVLCWAYLALGPGKEQTATEPEWVKWPTLLLVNPRNTCFDESTLKKVEKSHASLSSSASEPSSSPDLPTSDVPSNAAVGLVLSAMFSTFGHLGTSSKNNNKVKMT